MKEFKIHERASIKLIEVGDEYKFKDEKTNAFVLGKYDKEKIVITVPYSKMTCTPSELLAIWAAQKNKDLFDDVVRRSKQ